MVEESESKRQGRVLLVGAASSQVASLVNLMPEWAWMEAGAGWPTVEHELPAEGPFDAVIVFPEKGLEKHALALCEAIREREDMAGVTLFAAIDQYQMDLGNKVRRLPGGHFLMTPIEKEDLVEKMREFRALEGQGTTMDVRKVAQTARECTAVVSTASTQQKNAALLTMADLLAARKQNVVDAKGTTVTVRLPKVQPAEAANGSTE